jgi:hypothetical protein
LQRPDFAAPPPVRVDRRRAQPRRQPAVEVLDRAGRAPQRVLDDGFDVVVEAVEAVGPQPFEPAGAVRVPATAFQRPGDPREDQGPGDRVDRPAQPGEVAGRRGRSRAGEPAGAGQPADPGDVGRSDRRVRGVGQQSSPMSSTGKWSVKGGTGKGRRLAESSRNWPATGHPGIT